MRVRTIALTAALVVLVPFGSAKAVPLTAESMIDLVDPMIGTTGSGFVFPGPAAPFGMVQLSPDTDGHVASYTGYSFQDRRIRGFSHVHTQSMGVPSSGEVPIMPTVGAVVTDVKAYQTGFSKASEKAWVGGYSVSLDSGVDVDLTAGLRTGLHKYTFPAGKPGNIIIDAGRAVSGGSLVSVPDVTQNEPGTANASLDHLPDGTVVGTVRPNGSGPYTVHFALRTSVPASSFGVYASRGAVPSVGVTSVNGNGAGGFLTFGSSPEPRTVLAAVGISFVDRAGAIANLESESDSAEFRLEDVRAATREAWTEALSTVEISGGLASDRVSFATSLYHAQHHPNLLTDADGRYRGFDHATHKIGAPGDPMPLGSTYYANFSMWDTYRTQMPLLAWIQPARYTDMLRSLHAVAVQGGRLPHWGWQDRFADFMNGNPALPVIADGICRGLAPNDLANQLFQDARRMALPNGQQGHRDPVYLQKGYVPANHGGESFGEGAASTLEYATNDFSLALVADALGETADRDALLDQSENWRNVFDPSIGFMRPRNSDGTFVGNPYNANAPYMPELPDGWTEGTGWQYTWLVPHDPAALLAGIGPDAERKMDTFFSMPGLLAAPYATTEAQQKASLYGIAYYGNQYAPSNEHDLQAPWLYAYTQSAWKTDAAVSAYRTLYRPTPDGLPGNDDLGTMSAWFVWSALGLYPIQAGAPVYTMVAPLFDSAVISPADDGPVTRIESPGASLVQRFLESASIDGQDLNARAVSQRDLAGKTLSIKVSSVPGDRSTESLPPSASTSELSEFDCGAA